MNRCLGRRHVHLLLPLIRLRRRRRAILPLNALFGGLGALVVAGFVSRIYVIRRPHLQRQVGVLGLLPGEVLRTT
jgi:hypothetical protein